MIVALVTSMGLCEVTAMGCAHFYLDGFVAIGRVVWFKLTLLGYPVGLCVVTSMNQMAVLWTKML